MPRSARSDSGLASRRVQPRGDPGERRGGAAVHQRRRVRVALRELRRARAGQVIELLAHGLGSLQRRGVPGHQTLQPGEDVEGDRDRHGHKHNAADPADQRRVPPQGAVPPAELAAGEGDSEQRHGRSRREGRGEDDDLQPDAVGGSEDRDGGEDRSGAGNVDDAEREAEHEPAGRPARLAVPQPGERALKQQPEPREQVAEADQRQQRDARVPQRVLRQVQQRDDLRSRQDEHAEAQHQARDHRERAAEREPPRSGRRLIAVGRAGGAGGSAGDQHHGQDGQDARRDAGQEASHDAHQDELDHVAVSLAIGDAASAASLPCASPH